MSLGGRAFISTAAGWPPGWRIKWYCRASESGTHDCRRSRASVGRQRLAHSLVFQVDYHLDVWTSIYEFMG